MGTNDYNLKEFRFKDVMEECNNFDSISKQIEYLIFVKKEYLNDPPLLDPDGPIGPTLDIKLDNEIEWREEKLRITDPNDNQKISKIVWQRNKQDFAALFSSLMDLGFISFKRDKFKMLCEHFTWIDGEMTPKQLKQAQNNIKNRSDTHQLSDEMNHIIKILEENKGSQK